MTFVRTWLAWIMTRWSSKPSPRSSTSSSPRLNSVPNPLRPTHRRQGEQLVVSGAGRTLRTCKRASPPYATVLNLDTPPSKVIAAGAPAAETGGARPVEVPSESTYTTDQVSGGEIASEAEIALQGVSNAGVGADRRPSIQTGDTSVLGLNARWRIGHDDTLQWILQIREGKGWRGRRFHVERDPLLRSIGELCGEVDLAAVDAIKAWPPRYRPDFLVPSSAPISLPMAAE